MKAMSQLPYHYGIKLRFYPSNAQKRKVHVNSNAQRFYYNQLVAINWELYHLKQVKIYIQSVQERIEELKELLSHNNLKKHFIFLWDKYADSLALLANTKQNYQRAWDNYKTGLQNVPNFHAKKRHPYEDTYQTNCSYPKNSNPSVRLLDKKHLHLPKLKSVRVSHVRNFLLNKIDYRIGTVTIYKDPCDRYYASLQLSSETPFVKSKTATHKKLGIDLNTSNFLTDNHGNEVANPRYYRKQHNHLKRLQRSLSRRYRQNKGRNLRDCKNYQKMRRKVAQVTTHVKYQRRNFLQRLSTKLIENQDFLVAENLSSKNMLRNHRLAQSISDVGWRSFLTMLQYKGKLYDRQVILVDPKNTTQTCSNCNYIMKGENHLTLKNRQWTCPHCKQFHIRDMNAAQNILIKGLVKA